MSANKPIGDPLSQAASTGKIGGRQSTKQGEVEQSGSREIPNAKRENSLTSKGFSDETFEGSKGQKSKMSEGQKSRMLDFERSGSLKADRKQHTVYLPRELSKWLKIQAVEEEREISDIVSDALKAYRQQVR